MATIKEIAAKTGVSATTVSNVLHGRTAKVSAATLKKIQSAIEAEKYTPNMGAALLAHSVSRIIGVIVIYGSAKQRNRFRRSVYRSDDRRAGKENSGKRLLYDALCGAGTAGNF